MLRRFRGVLRGMLRVYIRRRFRGVLRGMLRVYIRSSGPIMSQIIKNGLIFLAASHMCVMFVLKTLISSSVTLKFKGFKLFLGCWTAKNVLIRPKVIGALRGRRNQLFFYLSVQRLSARFARRKIHLFLTCIFDVDFDFEKPRDIARSTRNVVLYNISRNQLLGSYLSRF